MASSENDRTLRIETRLAVLGRGGHGAGVRAGELARRLSAHPAVGRVRYPSLPDDPQHARAARQVRAPGQDHVPAGLLRISVGVEHVEDLWADLASALDAAAHP